MPTKTTHKLSFFAVILAYFLLFGFLSTTFAQVTNPQSGSAGLTGTVPSLPPTQAATITFPTNGQTFQDTPIEVTGLCKSGLTVKIFKNEVFGGAVPCAGNGTYTITVDLFSGTNELIARVFDDLEQPGPDSNKVTVTYNNGNPAGDIDRVIITTNFAKRGANPGSKLTWPFIITGGQGPYAISIDWGDGNEDLYSVTFAGDFVADHIYELAGTYKIIVKASDSQGTSSFLQVIGVANGPILSKLDILENADGSFSEVRTISKNIYVIWPLYIMLALIVSTFWLGRRYEKKRLRERLLRGGRFN